MPDPAYTDPVPVTVVPREPTVDELGRKPNVLVIRIWPNIPILYPMAFAALVCGILSFMFGVGSELKTMSGPPQVMTTSAGSTQTVAGVIVQPEEIREKMRNEQVIALVFLAVFAYSLVVLCTDIVLTWALLGVALITIAGMGLFIANIYWGILTGLFDFFSAFAPAANSHFYFCIFGIWLVLMIAAVIYARFHYVKIESNEVIVVGGVLDKRRRYSTMRMQYTKEVIDVFEYYLPLVRSGRLVLRFPNESEPIVIDHVMHVDRVVKKLDHVAASLQISREDPS
ncbi:MAG: hypothetical protein EOP86_08240 [Verrucomicrobiaceae bacterium]|nr:MAG: hypothetical protein EOP86_08240 [Verrucomicrobiaceae bacterium]